MAFNKQKKRKITVDEKVYYWSATGGDNYIGLSVMADIQGGSKLFCAFEYHQVPIKVENSTIKAIGLNDQFVITPYIVRQVM